MVKRMPAIKIRIKDVVEGKFFSGSKEELKPSYIITKFGEMISRVNILGTVIDKFVNDAESYMFFLIDDGTSSIRVKLFKDLVEKFKDIDIGDLVLVIGKVKQYLDEVYINGEIVRRVTDPNYEIYRKLELIKSIRKAKETIKEIKKLKEELSEEEFKHVVKERYNLDEKSLEMILKTEREEKDFKPQILKLIDQLDEGNGVEVMRLFDILKLPESAIESAITDLLNEGYIYEPEPGKFRRVKV